MMGAQENVDLVRRGYAAFSSGDMATLSGLFADDAVWTVSGTSRLSGPKHGRDAVLGFFGETMALSGGTFRVSLLDLQGGEERVYALQHLHAERDGKVLDQNAVNVFTVVDGKVERVDDYSSDPAAAAEFWD